MVFLSYAHKDGAKTAKDLFDALQKAKLNPWWDEDRLCGGVSWSLEIEQALDDCDAVAAILTEGSYRSDICRAEQLRALRKGKRVIPVFVDGDRPLYLEHLQYVQPDNLLESLGEPPAAKPLPDKFRQTRYDTVPSLPPEFTSRGPKRSPNSATPSWPSNPTARGSPSPPSAAWAASARPSWPPRSPRTPSASTPTPTASSGSPSARNPATPSRPSARPPAPSASPPTTWDNPNQLRNALRDRAALLILDDVWNADHAQPYLPDNARSAESSSPPVARRSPTSRRQRAHSLDVLPPERALAMLEKYVGKQIPEAEEIVERCGALPLALAIIGRLLRKASP